MTKTKTAYPTDEALKKIIYLTTMDVGDWEQCISQFSIYFSDRFKPELAL